MRLLQRPQRDALCFQRGANPSDEEQRLFAVAMDADGIRAEGDIRAIDGGDDAFGDHAHDALDGQRFIGNHCAGLAAGDERAVGLIAAVGKDLAGGAQTGLFRRRAAFRCR